ncbi:MAG: 50S ribosomal protein L30 [Candidatus Methanomethylophilaceae archaeon]|jgi:large subunit ribosomal protein L30
MAFAIVRVRGQPDVNRDIEHTMQLLNLTRVNHCVIVPEDDITKGMLNKAKDYVTWGEVSQETILAMLNARGRLPGNKELNEEYLQESTEFSSLDELAAALAAGEVRLSAMEGIKPVFRLHPPVKGYEGNKRSYRAGGALGYRGEAINELIARMI